MTKRLYLMLFLVGILVLLPVAYMQSSPGYMDADYYYAGGLRLAEGYGFSELILWNYLDDPTGLPHPSHGYWMPLASLVAALGMLVTSDLSFTASKLGFLLIAGFLPPLTAALAYSIHARRDQAIFSGILAAFPVFYLAYLGATDTFGIYMLLGAMWFIFLGILKKYREGGNKSVFKYMASIVVLGLLTGMMHLARADGILWFLLGFVAIMMIGFSSTTPFDFVRHLIIPASVFILGYLLVMGPWMVRNISDFGTPLAPGGFRALWLTEYNDIYAYPASSLTFQRWWSTGLGNILRSRAFALGQNLQTALVVQGGIILAPLVLLGMWRLRKDLRIKLGFLAWVATFFMMTFVFTEIGWRGGFFHSGAALQPLFWAVVPVGLEAFIEWGVKVRNWDLKRAYKGFGIGLLAFIGLLTFFIAWQRVVGPEFKDPIWNQSERLYAKLDTSLKAWGATPEDLVLVNNAPGYFVVSGRGAISIPNGNEDTVISVANRYGARYILLDENSPESLQELFLDPEDHPGFSYLGEVENTKIYLFGE